MSLIKIPNHDQFLQAIEDKHRVWIKFSCKSDKKVYEQSCAPLEYGARAWVHDGQHRYWFWDYARSTGSFLLGLRSQQIVELKVSGETFDATQFVVRPPPVYPEGSHSVLIAFPIEKLTSPIDLKIGGTSPPTPGAKDAPAPAKRPAKSPPRILVVDDDAAMRQLFSEVLTRSGYRVDTAEDGEAGWRVLHAVRHDPDSYDLLITDHTMPKLTGVELVKKLRSEQINLPIILASALVPTDAQELQFAAILPRPPYPDQLLEIVKKTLCMSTNDEWKV